MSLAILPSAAVPYSQPPTLSSAPSPSKRPKLSLNTAALPSLIGKKATSLRLETLSATSPTVRNTFSNAHEEEKRFKTQRAATRRPALTPLSISSGPTAPKHVSTPISSEQNEAPSSSATSSTSVSTIDSLAGEVPYRLTYNVSSILTNGPLPRSTYQRRQARPMFPAAKRVAFKTPLTEEVKTEVYTMRHSDIESSSSTISTLELSPPEPVETEKSSDTSSQHTQLKQASCDTSPQRGQKRESEEDEDSDTCPATPVAGRRKRDREWVWTLGPITTGEAAEGKRPEEAGIGDEKHEGKWVQ